MIDYRYRYRIDIGNFSLVKREGEFGLHPSQYSEFTLEELEVLFKELGSPTCIKVTEIKKVETISEQVLYPKQLLELVNGVV